MFRKYEMAVTRDKVRAIMLAIAAGDALGKTVEMFSAEEIKKRFGRITTYLSPPDDHKWAAGWPANRWTDDTSLSLAVLNALTEAGGIDMDTMVKHHIIEYEKDKGGFGPKTSTSRAIEALKAGKHWSETGSPNGKGNGAAMKAAPLGLFFSVRQELIFKIGMLELFAMTHPSALGTASGLVQARAIVTCLSHPRHFTHREFAGSTHMMAYANRNDTPDYLLFLQRMENLWHDKDIITLRSPEYILQNPDRYGNGGCYIPESLPFTYAHFLRNPWSIETLFDVVNAGGDTDTNGAMCGALLGAVNGMELFKDHEYLIEELWRRDELIAAADAFCDKFGIE